MSSSFASAMIAGRKSTSVWRSLAPSSLHGAPLVQWWFAVNALPEMLIAIFVSIVCFDRYLGDTETGHRAAYAAVILICAGMFALTLYPAWQISLGYLLAMLILWVVIRHWGQIRVSRKDVVILVGEIALFCVILGSAVMTSWGTIQSMLHTAYPGARQSTGGGLPPLSLISSVGTLFFPFKDYAVDSAATNMVEASRFVDLFPLGIILALFGMVKRKKADILSVCLLQSSHCSQYSPVWACRCGSRKY